MVRRYVLKILLAGKGGVAQSLIGLAAFPEIQSQHPHGGVCNFSSKGSSVLFRPFLVLGVCMVYRQICRRSIHIHKIKIINRKTNKNPIGSWQLLRRGGCTFYVGNWKVVYMLVDDPTPTYMCTRLIGLSGLNYYLKILEGRYREICVRVQGQWEKDFVGKGRDQDQW